MLLRERLRSSTLQMAARVPLLLLAAVCLAQCVNADSSGGIQGGIVVQPPEDPIYLEKVRIINKSL